MFERLGKIKYIIPICAIIAVFLIMSLAVSPLLRATPKDVPFAVVTLDKGVQTPAGDSMNMGAALVKKLSDGLPGQESPIKWSELSSQKEVDTALENNTYYGALVIPADFSIKQAAAAAGNGEAPQVDVMINQGKNAMLSTQMQTALTSMLEAAGLESNVTLVHSADIGGGGMSALMGTQMLLMPIIMMIIAGSVLLFFIFRPKRGSSAAQKGKAYLSQILYAAGSSLLMAAAALLIVNWAGGMTLPFGQLMLFLWIAAFCVMVLLIGTLDLLAPLGALLAVALFSCGMSSTMLAPEMLPGWYRDWFYPWVPQHFMGDGARAIIYMGDSAANSSVAPLLIMGAIGIVLFAIALFIPGKKLKDENPEIS